MSIEMKMWKKKEEHGEVESNKRFNKTCKYYLKDECNFTAEKCWYIHDEKKRGTTKGQRKQDTEKNKEESRRENYRDRGNQEKRHDANQDGMIDYVNQLAEEMEAHRSFLAEGLERVKRLKRSSGM